jgi:hypothetical protein
MHFQSGFPTYPPVILAIGKRILDRLHVDCQDCGILVVAAEASDTFFFYGCL